MYGKIINYLKKDFNFKIKFIIVGGINTLFGYFFGVINYKLLYPIVGPFFFGIINSVIAITFSFFMFKLLLFKTHIKLWFSEYLRSYVVYGFKIIVGILVLIVFLEFLKINIYISQAVSMIATVFVTYKGHKNFTFAKIK